MSENKVNANKVILPEPTIRRLPWYLSYVRMLHSIGVEYVSSTQISNELNVAASQIAKDLSFLNIKGKTRIGYEVTTLMHELEDFLGFTKRHNAVVIGVGNLGAALMQDGGLAQYGLNIVAGFDINHQLIGHDICGIPVYDIAELRYRERQLNVTIAILTVPVEHAQEVTDQIIASGLKAIWNFTPYRIKTPADIVIANTSIYAHLAIIYNRMSNQ